MKAIHRFGAGSLLLAAILAVLALRHVRDASAEGDEAGEPVGARNHAVKEDREVRSRQPDPARYQRIADRLLGTVKGRTMTDAAGDGESGFHQVVASLTSDDLAGVLRELTSLERGEAAALVGDLRLKLLLVWTEMDPDAASSFVLEGGIPPEACRIVATTWSKSDFDAALVWARALPEGGHRQEALLGLGNEMAFSHPQQAIELAREAGITPATEELLNQAAGAWSSKEPEKAAEWASGITDTALREKLVAGIATSWADQDPYAAAKLVIDSVNEGTLEENALVGIVQRFAFRDMDSARGWVTQFPEGRMRERAEMELARISERQGGGR